MVCRDPILEENKNYWTDRAPGYSEVNRLELATAQRQRWSDCICEELTRRFPDRPLADLQVLEVGTGPGFFAILLRELGCAVTAIDLTRAMLAEALSFADERFDAVISRNLTWNLPHPDRAYAEWMRVLKKGGVLLNFDANWYAYLFDEDAQAAWDRDRRSSAERGVRDQNVEAEGEHFDVMEEIARRVPLSKIARPAWDLQQLASLGLKAEADETVWKRVWSEEETISFSSTPMFLVRGRK